MIVCPVCRLTRRCAEKCRAIKVRLTDSIVAIRFSVADLARWEDLELV